MLKKCSAAKCPLRSTCYRYQIISEKDSPELIGAYEYSSETCSYYIKMYWEDKDSENILR